MTTQILVAGATGNLGHRIVKALRGRGAEVVALARAGAVEEKLAPLRALGARVVVAELADTAALTQACAGAACVVSALQGLRDVVVDVQSTLLTAAMQAAVPRFIPSDFSTDFTKLPKGENRNFDLRREFHDTLDAAAIAPTAIFNGAFAEILTYGVPLLDAKQRTVGYWEDADWALDFTTMDDTAAYTAAAALDPTTPRSLCIASFQITPRQLAAAASAIYGTPFELVRLGSRDELGAYAARERAAHPEGEDEVFPRWQQLQYMHGMFSTQHPSLDNGRYPDLAWANIEDVVAPRG